MESLKIKCVNTHKTLGILPDNYLNRYSLRVIALLIIFKFELDLGLDIGKNNLLKDIIRHEFAQLLRR